MLRKGQNRFHILIALYIGLISLTFDIKQSHICKCIYLDNSHIKLDNEIHSEYYMTAGIIRGRILISAANIFAFYENIIT